jgi:hypothetical protein
VKLNKTREAHLVGQQSRWQRDRISVDGFAEIGLTRAICWIADHPSDTALFLLGSRLTDGQRRRQ